MKLHYYASTIPNFGDELNPWLWPRLIPEILNGNADDGLFVGIGTLLNHTLPHAARHAVLGSGAGYGPTPQRPPETLHIYGVRGPLSAHALGLPPEAAVGDSAILLRTLDLPRLPLRYRVSFLPHFTGAILGQWPTVCREAGLHYIDPTQSVENILRDIRSSGLLLTNAMHGAIVADALRVPWIALRPFLRLHQPKWHDWAGALDLPFSFVDLFPSSPDEWIEASSERLLRRLLRDQARRLPAPSTPPDRIAPPYPAPFVPPAAHHLLNAAFLPWAARSLYEASRQPATLSQDTSLDRTATRLQERLAVLRRDYASGRFNGYRPGS